MGTKLENVIALTEDLFRARQTIAAIEAQLVEVIGDDEPLSHRVAPRNGRTLVAGAAGMFDDIPRPTVGNVLDAPANALVPTDHGPATTSVTRGLTERVAQTLDKLAVPVRARQIVDALSLETKDMKYVSAALTHLTKLKKAKKLDVGLFQSTKTGKKTNAKKVNGKKAARRKNGRH
jgi:hypothetical protein